MTNEMEDLWPDLKPAAIVTPAYILKTQAAALSQKSKGLLQGEVETWSREEYIYHRFYLVVPALDNYRYALLSLHHSPTGYPVHIDGSPIQTPNTRANSWGGTSDHGIPDERSFRSWLREAFNAPETRRILESLMAQATT